MNDIREKKEIYSYYIHEDNLMIEKSREKVEEFEKEKLCVLCHREHSYFYQCCSYKLRRTMVSYRNPLRFIEKRFIRVSITLNRKMKEKEKCRAYYKDGKECRYWALSPTLFCGVHLKKRDYISYFPNAIELCVKAIKFYKKETREFPKEVGLFLCDGGRGLSFSIHYNNFDWGDDRISKFPENIFNSAMDKINEERNKIMSELNMIFGTGVDGLIYSYYDE